MWPKHVKRLTRPGRTHQRKISYEGIELGYNCQSRREPTSFLTFILFDRSDMRGLNWTIGSYGS